MSLYYSSYTSSNTNGYYRYYQSWLESSVGFQDAPTTDATRYHADGTKLEASKDTALIAFAQLGCLKLNVKRGIITLISTARQYILAEATSTTSLLPKPDSPDATGELWFGNASIPRSQGISGAALAPPEYTANSPDGDTFTAPALVIDDLTKHPDYSSRAYAGNGISFYCGIPILTKDGSPIGVYTLSDDRPRDGLRPNELRYICDLAAVIMRHFEIVKNEAARFRGELMVVGLGQFVQGASTITSQKAFRPRLPSPQARAVLDIPLETRQFKGMTITAADPSALRSISVSEPSVHYGAVGEGGHIAETETAAEATEINGPTLPSSPNRVPSSASDTAKSRSTRPTGQNTFSRAANILRECCGADGVLFFDAVSTNLAKRSSTTGFRSTNQIPKDRPVAPGETSRQREASTDSRTSATMESEEMDSNDDAVKTCNLLGFAVDVTDQTSESIHALKRIAMTESILRRLTRKYPQGKVFYFTPDGTMSSSENDVTAGSATSESSIVTLKEDPSAGTSLHRTKNFKSKFADELKRLVPQAQSVIWLPMWDFSKQRWSAGAFLWTKLAEQLIVAQDDLVYLKTFANSIMIEVARQDAAFADDTKTTFIANISHELRSPLHGVIGSCELLKDTQLDEHQASLVKAIEMCGKTLNDTVDHVLDYTKINQFMKRGGQLVRPGAAKSGRHGIPIVDKSMLDDDFDLAVLVQDAVETVCASQSSHHQRLRDQSLSSMKDVDASAQAIGQKNVQVIYKLAHQDSWWVRSQPGAIKRILTNLVQNALKYTDNGTITVALSQRSASFRRYRRGSEEKEPDDKQNATITVTDTGRGMSTEFVRNHAFTPFSQESSFSDGTGLGLSIVQLIVDSLGGKIELKSNPEVGTEIKIHLTLPRCAPPEVLPEDDLQTVTLKTAGRSMCLVRRAVESHMSRRRALEAALSSTASTWFNVEVVRSTSFEDVQADFYVYIPTPKADHIIHLIECASLPPGSAIILLASGAAEKLELGRKLGNLERRGIILEIALHPVGPRKLGEVLKRCLLRKESMARSPSAVPARPYVSSIEHVETASYRGEDGRSGQGSDREDSPKVVSWSVQQDGTGFSHRQQASGSRPQTPKRLPQTLQSNMTLSPMFSASQTVTPTHDSAMSTSSNFTHKRILLVDDNAINLNILQAAMKKGKFEFYTANDGLEALEAFKRAASADPRIERPFTHVLMDISMPVMDGIESTRLIRSFEKQESRRIIEKSRQRSAWSDGGTPGVKYSKPNSPISGDEDDFASDFTGSLPVSPEERTEFDFTLPQTKRTRPLLSHLPTGGEPARAMTYYLDREPPQSLLVRFVEPRNSQRATIIALSGVAFEQTQKDMFAAGADMFFAKPIKLKELLKLLQETPSNQM